MKTSPQAVSMAVILWTERGHYLFWVQWFDEFPGVDKEQDSKYRKYNDGQVHGTSNRGHFNVINKYKILLSLIRFGMLARNGIEPILTNGFEAKKDILPTALVENVALSGDQAAVRVISRVWYDRVWSVAAHSQT